MVARLLRCVRPPFSMSYASSNNSLLHWLSRKISRTPLLIVLNRVSNDKYAMAHSFLSFTHPLSSISIVLICPLCLPIMPLLITCPLLATAQCQVVAPVIFILEAQFPKLRQPMNLGLSVCTHAGWSTKVFTLTMDPLVLKLKFKIRPT